MQLRSLFSHCLLDILINCTLFTALKSMKAQGPIQPGRVSPGRAPAQGQAPPADTACPLPPNLWGDHSFSFAFASKVVQQTSIYTADPKATNHQDPECPHRRGLS